MEFVPFLVLATLVKKTVDWVRVLMPDRLEARWLIPAASLVGALIALAFSASPELAGDITIWGEHTLASASLPLVVIYGVTLGTAGGVLHDLVKPNTPPHDGV